MGRMETPRTAGDILVLTKDGYVVHQLPIKFVTNKSIPDLRRKAAPGLDGRKIDATTATYSTCIYLLSLLYLHAPIHSHPFLPEGGGD